MRERDLRDKFMQILADSEYPTDEAEGFQLTRRVCEEFVAIDAPELMVADAQEAYMAYLRSTPVTDEIAGYGEILAAEAHAERILYLRSTPGTDEVQEAGLRRPGPAS